MRWDTTQLLNRCNPTRLEGGVQVHRPGRFRGPTHAAHAALCCGFGRSICSYNAQGPNATRIPKHRMASRGVGTGLAVDRGAVGGGCWADEADGTDGASALHDGLRWFLADMRPRASRVAASIHSSGKLGLV